MTFLLYLGLPNFNRAIPRNFYMYAKFCSFRRFIGEPWLIFQICKYRRERSSLIGKSIPIGASHCIWFLANNTIAQGTKRFYKSTYIGHAIIFQYISLFEKCLSFTDTSFTTTHLCRNMKPNLSNVVIFILIEQNGSYVIR